MYRPASRLASSALFALIVVAAAPADAGVRDCQRGLSLAAAKFVRLEYKALRRCNDAVVKGVRPGPCPDARTSARLGKVAAKLRGAVDKACGGVDGICGGADDESLAAVGWDVGTCPNFESGACDNPIADCGDVAECLACIGASAVAQAIALTYDDLDLGPRPSDVVGCQRALGKSTEKFFAAQVRALQQCEDRILLGYSSASCPDAIATAAIAKAEAKKVKAICKLCGGADNSCGGGDDLTPATIGFGATCPDVTVPGGAACAAPLTDLQSIVSCVDCVATFKATCADAAAVPAIASYPPECNGGAPPTHTPAATPTASPTPLPTSTPTASATLPLPVPTVTLSLPLPTVTLPLATVTLPLATPTLPLATPTVPLPVETPTITLALPTVTLPLPTVTLALPTVTLPLPTVTLPLPTVTLEIPTATVPVPTVTLDLPTVTLPLPTLTLPLATPTPLATATPTATGAAATPTASATRTPTPTSTAVCGNGIIEPGEACELPAVGCTLTQICLLCQQCTL